MIAIGSSQIKLNEHIAYGTITREEAPQVLTPSQTEAVVRKYFADIPVMVEIARCESSFRHHTADGDVLTGRVDGDDTGVMQINTRYHGAAAEALGLNLTNVYDNMRYARHLYEEQGTQPWFASAPCWRGSQVAMQR